MRIEVPKVESDSHLVAIWSCSLLCFSLRIIASVSVSRGVHFGRPPFGYGRAKINDQAIWEQEPGEREIVWVAEGKMNPVAEEWFLADISWQVYAVVND